MKNKLTEKTIEKLAIEVREYLLDNRLWIDVDIYFNGKRFTTRNPATGRYCYNDRENLFEDEADPSDYFSYVNPEHILSMSFEGNLCEVIYYCVAPALKSGFDAIFKKYGLYYELGDHWNMTCYYR